jgi:hypothetical protein
VGRSSVSIGAARYYKGKAIGEVSQLLAGSGTSYSSAAEGVSYSSAAQVVSLRQRNELVTRRQRKELVSGSRTS